jgi:hypothetical protein
MQTFDGWYRLLVEVGRVGVMFLSDCATYYEGANDCQTTIRIREARRKTLRRRWQKLDAAWSQEISLEPSH